MTVVIYIYRERERCKCFTFIYMEVVFESCLAEGMSSHLLRESHHPQRNGELSEIETHSSHEEAMMQSVDLIKLSLFSQQIHYQV